MAFVLLGSCGGSTDKELNDYTDDFDRSQFLTNLYDNSIIPSFLNFQSQLDDLRSNINTLVKNPNTNTLNNS